MTSLRMLMFLALLLDLLGHFLIIYLIQFSLSFVIIGGINFAAQWTWLVFLLFLYPLLGWLFGSYTVLRWRKFTLSILIQRLFITAVFTLISVATARWLINPGDAVWIVHRNVQLILISGLSLWAFTVRICLRQGLLLPADPKILLFAQPFEIDMVLSAWRRVPHRQSLHPVESETLLQQLNYFRKPIQLALTQAVLQDSSNRALLFNLETNDSNQLSTLSVLSLFENYQERLPPALIADIYLSYDDMPWAEPLSFQVQLKRIADLLLSAFLLFSALPFLILSALFIWLEDRGPVFYAQQRSGWMGRPFTVFKLRTMSVQPLDAPALWTHPGDQRITKIGSLLRRLRIDELPQLLNVLNGEMSLIGPRPERPELEHDLERHIPHYRKRHWMRPGLSGWAQVCAPYASSIEDSDLKLSYDLYYLRNFSTWLDFLILLRTIKTVLKAGGR